MNGCTSDSGAGTPESYANAFVKVGIWHKQGMSGSFGAHDIKSVFHLAMIQFVGVAGSGLQTLLSRKLVLKTALNRSDTPSRSRISFAGDSGALVKITFCCGNDSRKMRSSGSCQIYLEVLVGQISRFWCHQRRSLLPRNPAWSDCTCRKWGCQTTCACSTVKILSDLPPLNSTINVLKILE
jgi:hypothetical protein